MEPENIAQTYSISLHPLKGNERLKKARVWRRNKKKRNLYSATAVYLAVSHLPAQLERCAYMYRYCKVMAPNSVMCI